MAKLNWKMLLNVLKILNLTKNDIIVAFTAS